MSTERPPGLSLVRGEGLGEPKPGHTVALNILRNLGDVGSVQMSLPFVKPSTHAIISVGLDMLDYSSFELLVKTCEIAQIVDIRISPSFWGRGFSRPAIDDLFFRTGIVYRQCPELANVFVGDSALSHAGVVLERFRDHIRAKADLLQSFGTLVSHGPVLLVSRSSLHAHSERAIVVEELARIGVKFDLHVVGP